MEVINQYHTFICIKYLDIIIKLPYKEIQIKNLLTLILWAKKYMAGEMLVIVPQVVL